MAGTRLISLSGSASQAGGYLVDHVTVSACKTRGHRVFHVVVDDGGTGARRARVGCGQSACVADSGEYWMGEEAEPVPCECGGSTFEFVVSFSLHPDGGAVRMICAGVCCLSGGMPGSSAGWDIRDHPGLHLLGQA
jgi:hypothetical protein